MKHGTILKLASMPNNEVYYKAKELSFFNGDISSLTKAEKIRLCRYINSIYSNALEIAENGSTLVIVPKPEEWKQFKQRKQEIINSIPELFQGKQINFFNLKQVS